MNHKGKVAIFQISVLIMGIMAFACLIGNIPMVSAVTGSEALLWLQGRYETAAGAIGLALIWGAICYLAASLIADWLELDYAQTQGLLWGATIGGVVGGAVLGGGAASPALATGWGLLVGVVIGLIAWSVERREWRITSFSCNAWDAPVGGEQCELCNQQILPCSEYQCKSLGQACELINKGTEDELCVHVGRNDFDPPIIEPWEEELDPDFEYADKAMSPPDRGVEILYTDSADADGCMPAFTPLTFGVTLDEPAKCKVDPLRRNTFEEMSLFLSSGTSFYNHTIKLSLPGTENLDQEGLEVRNDGNYELYVRCEDANGNPNIQNFVFFYCVEKGPDETVPWVEETSILNNMPVAFGQDTLDVTFYLNEPSECKWSHQDESFDNMANAMVCATNSDQFVDMRSKIVYPCETTLNGIEDRKENHFYIRCKDQPSLTDPERVSDRNVNTQSYVYTVIGTQNLVIDDVSPNETTVKAPTTDVKVTLTAHTSAGHNEGVSICSYSEKGEENYIKFFNTNSYTHSTDLYLEEGEYEYDIKCVDLGGNADVVSITFEAESDSESPMVVRAYKSDNSLKVVTDEDAECVYGTQTCNYLFNDGLHMITSGGVEHFIDWSTRTKFYIKCKDQYGNEPDPNDCSAIVRAID